MNLEDEEVGGQSNKVEPDEGHIWFPWQPHTPAAARNSYLKAAPRHTLKKSRKSQLQQYVLCTSYNVHVRMYIYCMAAMQCGWSLLPDGAVNFFNFFASFRDGK